MRGRHDADRLEAGRENSLARRGDLAHQLARGAKMGRGSEIDLGLQTALQPERYQGMPVLRLARFANDLPGGLCLHRRLGLVEISELCVDLCDIDPTCGRGTQLGVSRAVRIQGKKKDVGRRAIALSGYPCSR